MLDKLDSLPNYNMYVTDSSKKNIKYGFWSRSTIPYKLECEKSHPKDALVRDVNVAKQNQNSLNETGLIVTSSIGFSCGFLAAGVLTVLFCIGTCKRGDCGNPPTRIASAVCTTIQFIMFLVCFFIIWGQ